MIAWAKMIGITFAAFTFKGIYCLQDCHKVSKRNLREGDLVFFHNGRKKRIASHVGIYLKDNKFIHASTSRGVIISSLNEDYYRKHWLSGGRP